MKKIVKTALGKIGSIAGSFFHLSININSIFVSVFG